ncbi:MAG: toxin [Micrococcales bacterium]|nr:toxin [Micrococcales bacterium]
MSSADESGHRVRPADGSGLRRVRVVGCSGAGKTTFATALATRIGVPRVELDAVFWDAGWVQRDPDQARELLAAFLAGPGRDGWVADGNWNHLLRGALDGAEQVVWLDLPRRVVVWRVLRRTVWRGVTRRELWHGNRERLTNLLRCDPEQNIVRWAWTAYPGYRRKYTALIATGAPVVRLTTARAARHWLAGASGVRPNGSR